MDPNLLSESVIIQALDLTLQPYNDMSDNDNYTGEKLELVSLLHWW